MIRHLPFAAAVAGLAMVCSAPATADDTPDHGRPVVFDTAGHATRNGKPAFPVGLFVALSPGNPETAATLDTLADSHVDFFINYAGQTSNRQSLHTYYDQLAERGFVEFYPLEKFYKDIGHPGWQLEFDETEKELVQSHVNRAKGHTALAGYYIQDELPLNPPLVREHHEWVKEADPSLPTLVVTSQTTRKMLDILAPTGDIFALDKYPMPVRGGVAIISETTRKLMEAVAPRQPAWFVAQAFGDYVYDDSVRSRSGPAIRPRKLRTELRAPTPAEMRCMIYQSLVSGVNGLVIYYYTDIDLSYDRATRWPAIKNIISDIRQIEHLLAAEPWQGRKPSGDNQAIQWRPIRHEGKIYILAVNTSRDFQSLLLTRFPDGHGNSARTIQGNGFAYASSEGGRAELLITLDALETIVVEVN